jgi:D-3-phosphoglycerate dehydrogenase
MQMKIVITDDRFGWIDEERRVFEGLGAELVVADCHTQEDLIHFCADADAILLNQAPMTAEVIEHLEKCRVISRYGIGYDNVDHRIAERRGIWVTNVPGYCTEEVAEHALGLLLSCVRGIPFRDRSIRQGRWNLNQPIRRMSGSTLGIVGFGATGRAFWEKVQGFGFSRILVADNHGGGWIKPGIFAQAAGFEEIIRESDFISLHVPLNERTRYCINTESLAAMKDGVIIVNTSRGPIIDEAALVLALQSGKVAAAGLDVFEREPLPADSPLLALDNAILTDHSAYYSREAVSTLKTRTAMNARDVLEGRPPKTPVNHPPPPIRGAGRALPWG